ncbi:hypothetical protein ACWEWX_09265 [Streptomyces asiaticus]|uniref:hypothetical protein n=1 Tax=Streptomyces asiaticus TaxID=114695 RepID=UPI003D70CD0E
MTEPGAELVVPQGQQHRLWGRTLVVVGWTLRIVGTLAGLIGIQRGRTAGTAQDPWGTPYWGRVLMAAGLFVVGSLLFLAGRFLAARGRQHVAHIIRTLDEIGRKPFVLYLRPFADDPVRARMPSPDPNSSIGSVFRLSGRTQEETLRRLFRPFGVMVAIGRPGERLPLPGALRAYLPLDDWQDTVARLIAQARLVVLGAGPGPGTIWELVEAVRVIPPARLVLIVHHDEAVYEQFRRAAAAEFAARLPRLRQEKGPGWTPPVFPAYPPLTRPERLTSDYVLKGMICFGPGWEPRFIRFDPTAPRRRSRAALAKEVNRSLEPLLRYLKEPGTAPVPGSPPNAA